MSEKAGYRSIMKATSIFGGVQVFNIIITLVRGKLVSVLIGPSGMGLNSLFLSGTNLVKNITSLGLSSSAVRDLAKSHGNSPLAFNRTYTVFKSWIWFTALLGVGISILFAPLLSRFAFGDDSQTFAFIFLSSTFLFTALSGGIYTVLRASRKISLLAKANIYGSLSGLLTTIPILYIWRIDGVMPSIIVSSFTAFTISLLFRKYVDVEEVELSLREKFELGKPMVSMGISMSLSTFLASAAMFLLSAFITRMNGLADLGLYSAANSIMVGYVGMVFSAMSADYVPRLSQVIENKKEWSDVVNQQAEVVLLILIVVLGIMMGSVVFMIKLLLSSEFLGIAGYIIILGLSVPIKALVWSLSYIYLAKGDSKFFFKTELFGNIVFLFFNILGYYFYGLIGIGFAQILAYLISLVFNIYFIQNRYKFNFSHGVKKLLYISMILLTTIFLLSSLDGIVFNLLKWLTILVSISYSLIEINRKMDLLSVFHRKTRR